MQPASTIVQKLYISQILIPVKTESQYKQAFSGIFRLSRLFCKRKSMNIFNVELLFCCYNVQIFSLKKLFNSIMIYRKAVRILGKMLTLSEIEKQVFFCGELNLKIDYQNIYFGLTNCIKFSFSQKATKICAIVLYGFEIYLVNFKTIRTIAHIFVAF